MKLNKESKDSIKSEDDTLYGLLSSYKIYNTYFRILVNKDDKKLTLHITDNPKKWPKADIDDLKGYLPLRRSEIRLIKMSVKYLSPEHILDQFGPTLGLKATDDEIIISDKLKDSGFYSITMASGYLDEITANLNKIIDLTPKKKYEILEHFLSKKEAEKETKKENKNPS